MKRNEQGIVMSLVLVLIVLIAIGALGCYVWRRQNNASKPSPQQVENAPQKTENMPQKTERRVFFVNPMPYVGTGCYYQLLSDKGERVEGANTCIEGVEAIADVKKSQLTNEDGSYRLDAYLKIDADVHYQDKKYGMTTNPPRSFIATAMYIDKIYSVEVVSR